MASKDIDIKYHQSDEQWWAKKAQALGAENEKLRAEIEYLQAENARWRQELGLPS